MLICITGIFLNLIFGKFLCYYNEKYFPLISIQKSNFLCLMTLGTESVNADLITEDLNQSSTLPSHNDVAVEDACTSEPTNDTTTPQTDRMSDGVRWRGPAENTPHPDSQSSILEDHISIRIKFMENERTMSVNRAITVGELKR